MRIVPIFASSGGLMATYKVNFKNTKWSYTYLELPLLLRVPILPCARQPKTTASISQKQLLPQLKEIFT